MDELNGKVGGKPETRLLNSRCIESDTKEQIYEKNNEDHALGFLIYSSIKRKLRLVVFIRRWVYSEFFE
jgi:hypothetical protein